MDRRQLDFQRLSYASDAVSEAIDIRKHGERPFNLLKKREGREQVRVRSQPGLVAKSTFTTIATLLLEIASTRKKKKKKEVKQIQGKLFAACCRKVNIASQRDFRKQKYVSSESSTAVYGGKIVNYRLK